MNRWLRFTGIVGLVVLLMGIILGLLLRSFSEFIVLAHLAIGAVLVIFWLIRAGDANLKNAGNIMLGRNTRFGVNALLYSAVFAGILAVINLAVARVDWRADLTEQGVYSLSEQSERVISGLQKPLKIVALKDVNGPDTGTLKDLLGLYARANRSKVTTDIIDPRVKMAQVEKYEMKPGNLIYLEYGEENATSVSRLNDATEEQITNAIIRLTRGNAKKIYYVQGHQEPALDNDGPGGVKNLAEAITNEHMTISGLLLGTLTEIPKDAAAVILASPKKALRPEELELLMRYGDEGGRLVLLTDPRTTEDVKNLAGHFGIVVGDNVIIDPIERLVASPVLGAQPIIRTYIPHAITRSFTPAQVTIFNIASTVQKGIVPPGGAVTELAKTGMSAWGESNMAAVFDNEQATATREENDIAGPVPVAAVYEKKISDASAPDKDGNKNEAAGDNVVRVAVFGDSDWIQNDNLDVYSNRDLILNAINWVAGEEGAIAIHAKSMRASLEPIEWETLRVLFITSFLIPELLLLLGLMVWWSRKTIAS